jgi:hypothetical protein
MIAHEPMLSRRALGQSLAGAAAATALQPAFGAPLSLAPSPLQRFMKIYVSTAPGTVWYWYDGTIEMALPDAPVMPLAGVTTLIRRDVTQTGTGEFTVVSTEANYFHALDDDVPSDSIVNPATGRMVQPLHFSESARAENWTQQWLAPFRSANFQTLVTLREAGPYTWLYRTFHVDTPHPLDIAQWPLEASGKRSSTGSFATHCALTRDLLDPAQPATPCSFTYEAVFGWLPWLLMGQRPGQLLWRATGMKLPALDALPASSRAAFERLFPAIFTGGDFGPGGADLWDRYRLTRTPAKP